MPVKVDYKKSVYRDLKKIGIHESTILMDELEKVLSEDPDKSEPLKGKNMGMFKLRVGDYRIIYAKTKNGVLILRVLHRKHAYR